MLELLFFTNRNVYLTVDFFSPKADRFFCHFQVKPALLEVHNSLRNNWKAGLYMGKLLPKVWRRLNGNIDCVCTRDFIQTKYSHIAMC